MKRPAKRALWPYLCALISGAGIGCWVSTAGIVIRPEVIAAASATMAVLWLATFDWTDRMLR